MPHIYLDYSSNVPGDLATLALMKQFHSILADHGVSIGNCKSRATERVAYVVGDGSRDESFVHLDVAMLEGRSPEAKESIGTALLRALIDTYGGLDPEPQLTVEIRDIPRTSYFKHPAGTI